MLQAIPKAAQDRISKNILAACKNIDKLNGPGYRYIMNCNGFIAHYNIDGFKTYYSEPGTLAADILANARFNQWGNFRPGERDADYYHSKRDAYNLILEGLK